MFKIRQVLSVLAILSVLAFGNSARAALKIYAQQAGVNGGAITEIGSGADFTAASFTGVYGDFTLTVFSGSSANGAVLSDLLSSTTRVTNNSGSEQTITLYVSQDSYTLPSGSPLSVESGMSGTVNIGTVALTNIFQAYADDGNALLGTGDFTNGPQTGVPSGSTFDTGSATGLFTRVGTYSLTSMVVLTMSGGGQMNYSSHVNVRAIPEPITLSMWGILGAAGLTFVRRRR